jgi:hypothetical protein
MEILCSLKVIETAVSGWQQHQVWGGGGPPAMTGFFYLSGSSDRFPLIVRISFLSVEIGSVVSC